MCDTPAASGSRGDPCTPEGFVEAFEALTAERAALDARHVRLLAAASGWVQERREPTGQSYGARDLAMRSLVADLACTARLSEYTLTRLMNEADDLCARFPGAVDALESGRLGMRHVQAIRDAGWDLDDEVRETFVARAVAAAETLTPGRLAPVLAVAARRLDPECIGRRYSRAREDRSVRVRDLPDGVAMLTAIDDAVLIHGIHDRLTTMAHSIIAARPDAGGEPQADEPPAPADTRTIDQLRADVLTDLLLTASPTACSAGVGLAAITATVQVTLPVLTMTGASTEPALLAGHGPIDQATAAALAGAAKGWERVMTHPVTGAVLAVDRYRPTADLTRLLAARDEHCRFPGCRRHIWRCDRDHTIDAALGGITCDCNLAHLCKRHHILKHHSEWTVVQRPGGVLEWTSPSGRTHLDVPAPVVRFIADPDPPPRTALPGAAALYPALPHRHRSDAIPF